MSNKKTRILVLILVAWILLVSAALYPLLPDRVPSHWDADGQINGTLPKPVAVFLMPFIALALFILLNLLPRLDPRRDNIEKFRTYYNNFQVILVAFLLYVHLLTLMAGLSEDFHFVRYLCVGLGFLFFAAGSLLQHTKRNWLIGIRTPWTLESEKVWDKTHAMASKLFQALGILIAVSSLFIVRGLIWIVIVPLVLAVIYTLFYSYFLYRREKN